MSSSLYRLGRAMARARWKAVGAWLLIILVAGALAIGLGGRLTEQFDIPGTEAQEGLDQLDVRFPEMSGASGEMVFVTSDGTPIEDHAERIGEIMDEADAIDGVAAAPDPFDEQSQGTVSEDGDAIIGSIQMDGELGSFPESATDELTDLAQTADGDGLEVHLGGQILQPVDLPFGISEVVGVIAALIIMAVTFRAILPAVIPVTTALVGVGVAMTVLLIIASEVNVPSVTPTLAVMLGLAVGIDYALFIVARHRDQLREGEDVVESIARAIATSGSAVIFAGVTSTVALVGLFVTGIPFLTLMGFASAGTMLMAVVIALTLLPAMLGIFGERMRPKKIRRLMEENGGVLPPAEEDEKPRTTPWVTRWVRLVTRVPALTVILVVVGIGALAIPALDMRLALPDLGTEDPDSQARQTYDVITEEFGPGYNGPLLVTADIINTEDPLGVVEDLADDIEGLGNVEEIQLAVPNRTADLGVVVVIPTGGQTDQSTEDLVRAIRENAADWEGELGVSEIRVTGQTAVGIDISQRLSDALLPFAVFVVGLSLILLALVFRSIWVPVKAAVCYLLSIGAAFGAVAMVFEYGWFNEALNIGIVGPVISFMPIMVMGVLFGLAMDYEVFLVSRMREEYVKTGDAKLAIERGFTSSAPVVIAAALIMVAVFASFIPEGTFMIQPIAVALAVGVIVDAFVVRMTLVPAVLAMLGHHAWWLPRWLDRMMPRMDVEGEGLTHVLEHRRWTEENGQSSLRFEDVTAQVLGAPQGTEIGPLSGAVGPGGMLMIRSRDRRIRATFLALVSGRTRPLQGTIAVHDRLIPEDIGAVQGRTHVIAAGEDIGARLRGISDRSVPDRTVLIESVTDLADAGEDALRLLESMLRRGATAVIGCAEGREADAESEIIDALEDPEILTVLTVDRLREGAHA
ncbi:MAG: MMPL family transporter [Brachybacterium sp.]|nr:MMPL family transporter [Brachybacterium sp.]